MDASSPTRTTCIALLVEGGLGGGALLIGWLVGHSPAIGMRWSNSAAREQWQAAGIGLAAVLPLMVVLLLIDRFPVGPLHRLRSMAYELIGRMFARASVAQLAIVAMVAGLGEELLFRGLLQSGLARLIGGPYAPWVALATASVVFGVCHWLNATYAVLASLAGAYFGLLLMATGSLWTPIVAHAIYDFLALAYLVRPNHLVRSGV
jgi:CAAX protease family protein